MAHLIDKDALVAEIEKLRKNAWESFQKENSTEEQYYLRYGVILDILSFINTLEVKEVDLDKMLTGFMSRYAYENGGEYPSAIDIAKHFFELGLKAQKS